eukprot:Sspe_Gene.115154::Locus_102093_Transcript_1_1_Confidence_1.000_Length_544::g.115154::m.115154/K01586/lysA; diaminopimelate decarboxylase
MAWVPRMMRACAREGVLREGGCYFCFDLDTLRKTIQSLHNAFPPNTLHAFAAKANPLRAVLAEIRKEGMGCEAASIGELEQSLRIFREEDVVFDSPCKTVSELRRALSTRCLINIDNFQELERVKELVQETPPKATIGLRINPQVGQGSLSAFSTGTKYSKF